MNVSNDAERASQDAVENNGIITPATSIAGPVHEEDSVYEHNRAPGTKNAVICSAMLEKKKAMLEKRRKVLERKIVVLEYRCKVLEMGKTMLEESSEELKDLNIPNQ